MSVTRRNVILTGGAASLAACAPRANGSELEARVRASRNELFAQYPSLRGLAERSAGMLIIPEIVKGGLIVGGSYGEGALLVGDAVVDYISVGAASLGFQAGVQTFGQALFFISPAALANFRQADGWQLGVDAEATVLEDGIAAGVSSTTLQQPIYEVVYGQRGLLLGASLEGAKYNRLIR
ncbi:twin-arginine translocation pathway signal [Rhodobacteraceae bacterium 2CG4]|uniref:Twin-arginine translocation pathway signal n=1 Tax=Halovulum marinum TaxID=2662447 RepID=A0A6L5Z083_9RHOB|nr:YSC84-related protein [Halovulum marinum]MSU89953.1 twin-arginine translocation pathway signal [Halovulum marinum]